MGRRLGHTSEFESWRDDYLAALADEHGADFADDVAVELADEVAAFGPDDRGLLTVLAEARVFARRTS